MKQVRVIVLCSALKVGAKKDRTTKESIGDLYFNTGQNGETWFSEEKLQGNHLVILQKRTKGEKYIRADKTEGIVDSDGYNFVGLVGGKDVVTEFKAMKLAVAEMD